jgi:hypothetical protein
MKRWLLLFSILGVLPCVLTGAAAASERPTLDARYVLRLLGGTPGVPSQWSGIWSTVDTTYNCVGTPLGNSASTDTLCTGQGYLPDEETGPTNFQCDGTANSTSFDITCTGSEELFKDCVANFSIHTVGTRSGDSYFSVSTMIVSYVGTGEGCNFLPGQCTQFNSHGTRIAPEPTAYCSTPVIDVSWGRVKSQYR